MGVLAAVGAALTAGFVPAGPAASDTAPPSTSIPPTVSAESLPTVQISGVVWAQVMVGNTVYATGNFTKARPAGSAPGVNEVTRTHLLAYDVTTGKLLPFNHTLDGEGRSIAASPNGSRIYVGGKFTRVDGKVRNRIAAFNTADGSLVSSFDKGVDATVRAIAATDTAVYIGGSFSSAAGQTRTRLAAFSASGALLDWKPTADRQVAAMVMSPDRTKVVFGGSFSTVSGKTYHALAAADAVTGAPLPWASQSSTYPIRNDGPSSGITSLSANSSTIFLTGYNYNDIDKPGGFEGRAAISPVDGKIIWLNDCHGDSNSAYPVGDVLYSVGHAHDCKPAGAFPEVSPRAWHRALAETIKPTHTNGPATGGYTSFEGQPASTQLVWYPNVNSGTATGQNQGGWSIVGNSSYVSMGGEFTLVSGRAQQGLARFAVKSLAPNDVGPSSYSTYGVTATKADSSGVSTVTMQTTWDRDNERLTYRLYRTGSSTPVYTATADSRFWRRPVLTFKDSGLPPGSTPSYKLVATDPFGNGKTTTTPPA